MSRKKASEKINMASTAPNKHAVDFCQYTTISVRFYTVNSAIPCDII